VISIPALCIPINDATVGLSALSVTHRDLIATT